MNPANSANPAEADSSAGRPQLTEPAASPKDRGTIQRLVGSVTATWADIDRQVAGERSLRPGPGLGPDPRAAQILVVSAAVLTLAFFFSKPSFFHSLFGAAVARSARLAPYRQLIGHSYWCLTQTFLLALVPLVHIRLRGERPSDYGLARGLSAQAPTDPTSVSGSPLRVSLRAYLALLVTILPVVILASFRPAFQQIYPIHRQADRSLLEFLVWETQYLCMFFAVEFFFRGYLLFGLRRALGSQAIFVAMVPYCMVHFTKPPAEALGAIVTGLVLGTLAMATRSIWGGVLLHMTVALTMDLSAILQRHSLPSWRTLFPT